MGVRWISGHSHPYEYGGERRKDAARCAGQVPESGNELLLGVGGHEKGKQSEYDYGKDHCLVVTAAGSERFAAELFRRPTAVLAIGIRRSRGSKAWSAP